MERKLLIVLLIVSTASSAVAIKCHVCAAGGLCNGTEIGELQTCQTRHEGLVANQCMRFDGELSAVINDENPYYFKGVLRKCFFFPANQEAPPLQCFSDSHAIANYRYIFRLPYTNETSIKGDLCFCDSDGCNGVDSLKPFLFLILTVGQMHLLLM